MFCFTCKRSAPSAYGNADDAFTKTGFCQWKKAHRKDGVIQKHMNFQCHKSSCVVWNDYGMYLKRPLSHKP